jgi:hypothetical protein
MTTWPDTGTSEPRTHAELLQAAMDIASAAEDAAAVYTDAVAAALAAADPWAIPFRSGVSYSIAAHTGLTTAIPGNRTAQIMPFRPAKPCTLSKVSVEQTVAGEAGSLIRLGIIEDSDGFPTDVLSQSSAIAGDGSNGEKSYDPDLAIVPTKLYYAFVLCNTAVTTRPTLRYLQSVAAGVRTLTTTQAATGRQGFTYGMGSDAALTDPLVSGTVAVGGGIMPCFWLTAD